MRMRSSVVWGVALWGILASAGMEAVSGPPPRLTGEEEKVYPLAEVREPRFVRAWSDRLYISDSGNRDVLIYSLPEVRFLGRIGRAGQGPGEFDAAPKLVAAAGGLAAKSFAKLQFFSLEGTFQRETKGLPMELMLSDMPVFPIEGGYIGFPFVRGEDGRMNDCVGRIYDAAWKPVRDFGDRFPSPAPPPPAPAGVKAPIAKQELEVIRSCAGAAFADGKVYLADSRKGFDLAVFNLCGEKTGEIRVPLPPRKVRREEKQQFLDDWREARKRVAPLFDPIIADVFPAFVAFRLDGERIYLVTAEHMDGRYEILTLDLGGKILKRGFLFPLEPLWRYPPATDSSFDILDGLLYSVAYNEGAEHYELRVTSLR
jgi:hypothetical protein